MLEKKIVFVVAIVAAVAVAYLGYAIHEKYPESDSDGGSQGAGA